jgi:class 3 adenylate cyclase/tetratricopeptide (TPR) repeat protein
MMWYTFGDYILDIQRYELCRAGILLKLQPKVFELLTYLIQYRDRVVTRQELFDTLWPEQFVSDDALERLVVLARRAVGDSGRAQRVIKTVHGRGYCWVVPVEEHSLAPSGEALLTASTRVLGAVANPAVLHPVGAERKQVTVLSCALSAVVTQAESLDPETLYAIRQRLFTLAQREVQRYGGTIQHFVDNGFLAFFGASVAQEDHAQRAVLVALRIREQFQANRAELTLLPGHEPAVGMAVHTGEVIVGPIGADPRRIALAVGDTTQIVERLLRLAEPGAILLSDTTGQLVGGAIRLEEIGPLQGPDTTRPQTAYKVLGRVSQSAGLGWQGRRMRRVFVGREREMSTLHALLAQVENGHGQVVGIAGEPGIGKSRLLYEFRQQVQHTSCSYLAGRCVSYGQATPYLPLLALLHQACGLTDSDTTEEVITKVRRSLQAVGMEPEEWGPYLLRLLGRAGHTAHFDTLSPQTLRARTFETLLQMQLHASHQRPLLLEVEDVHWIDPTSEEWLMALVERLAGAPLLLLLSYRAGYQPAWMGKSYATQLALQRLTADESRHIVRVVLQMRSGSEDLVQTIEAKGEGNPFFLEELAQAVVEQGDAHPTLVLPETVQAVLATRLDRLPPEAKTLLQVAAVVGREVSVPLLQAVTALAEAPLHQCLTRLQEAEFFYEARPVPELVYAFKHALTQEVAYQSLFRSTRQQYHRQIAELLVRQFPDMVETQPEVLAHHYTKAGLNEQAVPYWQRAGERAAARSAHREAVTHCTRGLEVLKLLPDTSVHAGYELGLHLALGASLLSLRGPSAPEMEPVWTRARELCEQVGDTAQLSKVLTGLSAFHGLRGQLQAALERAEDILWLAQRAHDDFLHCVAHYRMGFALFFRGVLVPARSNFEQALALDASQQYASQQYSDRELLGGFQDHVVSCLSHLTLSLIVLGYPDQAVTRIREALTRAQEIAHPYSQVYALVHAVHVHELRREVQAVQEHVEAMIAICEEQEFTFWLAIGRLYRGWVLIAQGYGEEGVAQMRQGIPPSERLMAPYLRALLAEAHATRERTEEGWAVLAEVLDEVNQGKGRFYAAELYRLKGELLLRQAMTNAQQAETCFQQALDLARQSQAKWWELRTAMSLSRLWQHQGRRDAACQLLAEVYGWFTEGFDTADLQEARALLHELQGE